MAVIKEINVPTPYLPRFRGGEEAGVWYVSEVNFPGLVAEAATQQRLVRKVSGLVTDLSDANRHLVGRPCAREVAGRMTPSRMATIKPLGSFEVDTGLAHFHLFRVSQAACTKTGGSAVDAAQRSRPLRA